MCRVRSAKKLMSKKKNKYPCPAAKPGRFSHSSPEVFQLNNRLIHNYNQIFKDQGLLITSINFEP